MKELIKEFNNMDNMKIFEIQVEEEYYVYYIQATDKGLEAGGCSNTGFMPSGLICEWEDGCSLDYHLEGLCEICNNDAMEEYDENL